MSTRSNQMNAGREGIMSLGKIYENRGGRWFIRIKGVQIWCDKQHRSFFSRKDAEWARSQIQGEIENGTFDPSFWAKKKKSPNSFEVFALNWL